MAEKGEEHEKETNESKLEVPSVPNASQSNRNNVVVKVAMVGNAQVGKTSLMVKYGTRSLHRKCIESS